VFDRRFDGVPMVNRGGNRWSINYGQRGGGERFLVHQADIQVQGHLFVPVQSNVKATAPEPKKEPLPEPERIVDTLLDAVDAAIDAELDKDYWREKGEIEVIVPSVEEGITDNGPEVKRTFNLQMLPGVGATLAKQLEVDGVTTEDEFIALGIDGLIKYKGIGENKARMILSAIEGMKSRE
jgi:hypothetical protein